MNQTQSNQPRPGRDQGQPRKLQQWVLTDLLSRLHKGAWTLKIPITGFPTPKLEKLIGLTQPAAVTRDQNHTAQTPRGCWERELFSKPVGYH